MEEESSKDMINNLVESDSSAPSGSEEVFSKVNDELVLNLFSSCYESVSSALSVVVSKDFIFKNQQISDMDSSSIEELEYGNFISVDVPFNEELGGRNFLLIEKAFCQVLVDLLLEGEGDKDKEIDEEGQKKVNEIFNQVLGTLGTALTSSLGFDVKFQLDKMKLSFGVFNTKEVKELSKWVFIIYGVEIPDKMGGRFIHLIPRDAVAKFYEILDTSEKSSEEEVDDSEGESQPVSEDIKEEEIDMEINADLEQTMKTNVSYDESKMNIILDIELPVNVMLGEADMTIHDVLQLCPGSIVELNRSVEEPVDVIVNNKLIAKGEVVVVDSYFALKITEIKSHAERIKSLGKE